MTRLEAEEIIQGKRVRAHEEILVAYAFLEGLNSPEALQRKEVLELVKALERTKKLTMGPSFELQDSIMCEVLEALSKFKKATKL